MKTIKHISLWVVAAAFMVVVPTRGNAQAVSKTYFNVDWQFNAPMGNSYADKASGWGMNFEGGYYVMPHMAIGAYIAYHTNNKYIDRQTLALSSSSALTTDQQHSLFQLPFGLLAKYRFTTSGMFEPYMTVKMGANYSRSNPGIGMKRLPVQNWSASLVTEIPRLGEGGAYLQCRSGYYLWKLYCNWEENFNNGSLNVADKPIFKIEEVLLNYAEAMCELGRFTQDAADRSINKLRDRAEVARMTVAQINDSFDPDRPYYYPEGNTAGVQVPALLWEIRRERIIELLGEGFGFYDVRRWRMAPWFINQAPRGIWVTKEYATANNRTLYNESTGFSDGASGSMTEGYLYLFNDPVAEGNGWLDKYYLYQVPTDEILLNPDITQNPGW